jgi:hypothetical protein
MWNPSENSDLEAQIDALIKKAGNSLRRQLDDVHRGHSAESGRDHGSVAPSDPASSDTGSTLERR